MRTSICMGIKVDIILRILTKINLRHYVTRLFCFTFYAKISTCSKVVHIFNLFWSYKKRHEAFEFFICHLRNGKYYQSQGSMDGSFDVLAHWTNSDRVCGHIGASSLQAVGDLSVSDCRSLLVEPLQKLLETAIGLVLDLGLNLNACLNFISRVVVSLDHVIIAMLME